MIPFNVFQGCKCCRETFIFRTWQDNQRPSKFLCLDARTEPLNCHTIYPFQKAHIHDNSSWPSFALTIFSWHPACTCFTLLNCFQVALIKVLLFPIYFNTIKEYTVGSVWLWKPACSMNWLFMAHASPFLSSSITYSHCLLLLYSLSPANVSTWEVKSIAHTSTTA